MGTIETRAFPSIELAILSKILVQVGAHKLPKEIPTECFHLDDTSKTRILQSLELHLLLMDLYHLHTLIKSEDLDEKLRQALFLIRHPIPTLELSSSQDAGICRKCGGKADVYEDYREQYRSHTCLSETCRHFYSECEGQTEVDCFLDYDEWAEKVCLEEEEED